jgi:hypothetical protein
MNFNPDVARATYLKDSGSLMTDPTLKPLKTARQLVVDSYLCKPGFEVDKLPGYMKTNYKDMPEEEITVVLNLATELITAERQK